VRKKRSTPTLAGWPATSTAIIDSQSVKRVEKGGARINAAGYDEGKKIIGKERHIVVNTLGLMVSLVMTRGALQERGVIAPLLKAIRKMFPPSSRANGDGGCHCSQRHARPSIPLEIVIRRIVIATSGRPRNRLWAGRRAPDSVAARGSDRVQRAHRGFPASP
jgi:hypothetical protein